MVLRGYLSHRDSKPEAATQVSAANNLSQDGYGNASGWLLDIYYTIHKQQIYEKIQSYTPRTYIDLQAPPWVTLKK